MKVLILLLVISSSCYGQIGNKVDYPEDKLIHLSAAFCLSAGTSTLLGEHLKVKHSEWIGLGVGCAAAIGKELYDNYSGKGDASYVDAAVSILGAGLGSFTVYFAINPRDKKEKGKKKNKEL